MKIYTITFSNTRNVGAVLQEYALFCYLQKQDHDVSVVNYLPLSMRSVHSLGFSYFRSNSVRGLIKRCALWPIGLYAHLGFKSFERKNIRLTSPCYTAQDIAELPSGDAYIVGSDQIWNTGFVGLDDGYFLNIPVAGRKISYAGSVGKDCLPPSEQNAIIERLSCFHAVSVRENTLQSALQHGGLSNVTHVLDPVFLLEPADYYAVAKSIKFEKYVFIYATERDPLLLRIARRLAKEHGLKLVQMNRIRKEDGVDKAIPFVTPDAFLGWLSSADYVVTNSFHCTAFSIILQKQFFVTQLTHLNSRLHSLLSTLELDSVIIHEDNDDLGPIDYARVEPLLSKQIALSKAFLAQSLS